MVVERGVLKWGLLLLIVLMTGCTSQHKNWKNNTYFDVSVGGEFKIRSTTTSVGVNYPLIGKLWVTTGVWKDLSGGFGPYWGVSYSWAPFAKKVPNK